MYQEIRQVFATATAPMSLRQLLNPISSRIGAKDIVIRIRAFPDPTSTGEGLTIFREGASPDNGDTISNPGHQANLIEIHSGNDPAWLDSLRVGRHSTSSGNWTLVLIVE